MNIIQETQHYTTSGRGMLNLTQDINTIVAKAGIPQGLCNLFLQHTSASIILCENADKQVQIDLEAFMQRICPDGDPLFKHIIEGKDDMPAHVRTVLTQNSLSIPFADNKLLLGTWQGIYLWEHRFQGFKRKLTVTVMG